MLHLCGQRVWMYVHECGYLCMYVSICNVYVHGEEKLCSCLYTCM